MSSRRVPGVFVLGIVLVSGVSGGGEPGHRPVVDGAIKAFSLRLAARAGAADLAERERARVLQHQIRGFDAMEELVMGLPQAERPRRLLYLASGSHLAPLAICEALAAGTPCELQMTEVDPSVQGPIGDLLGELVRLALARDLESGEPLSAATGTRTWRLRLDGHPVSVTLRVEPAPPGAAPRLVRAADLAATDLVISHDWSGDPLANLQLVFNYLVAARATERHPPPLMIEDLERHPYPVDLNLFCPLARTTLAYGHRASDAGVGRHGRVELGEPVFGGGVLLGFAQPWWREVDPETLEGIFNFLLLNQFDTERENVLEGGVTPLLAPPLLDWWTGFGRRTIRDQNLAEDPTARIRMLRAVAALAPRLTAPLRGRLACRLQLCRCLLHARAAGADLASLMPAATCCRTLEPRDFPSQEMDRLYREAVGNQAVRTLDQQEERAEAQKLLEVVEVPELLKLVGECPVAAPPAAEPDEQRWGAGYRAVVASLAAPTSCPGR